MSPGLSAAIAEVRMSRRSAARLLGGVGAALTFERLRPTAFTASAATRPVTVTTRKENRLMIATNQTPDTSEPTVVLVHGAFADSSSWNGVIELLQEAGVSVTTAQNPLRGVIHDSAYVASVLRQIPGPVLLVGHSYGGVVISNAGSQSDNVLGLVYVAGFLTDEGETLGGLEQNSKDSVLNAAIVPQSYPTGNGDETAIEFTIDPAKIQEAFAADLPWVQTAVMAATQRPIAEASFTEATTSPAWKSMPSWAVIPTGDKAAGTDVLRFTAGRAGSTIVEMDASHVVMMSQPRAVTDVILTALAAVSESATQAAA